MSEEIIEKLLEGYEGLSSEELVVARNNAMNSVLAAKATLEICDLESLPLGEKTMLLNDFHKSLANLAAIRKALNTRSTAIAR